MTNHFPILQTSWDPTPSTSLTLHGGPWGNQWQHCPYFDREGTGAPVGCDPHLPPQLHLNSSPKFKILSHPALDLCPSSYSSPPEWARAVLRHSSLCSLSPPSRDFSPDLSSWRLFPITLLLYNAPVTIKIYPKPLSFSTTLILATITTSSNLSVIDLGARSFCCEVVLGIVGH